MLGPGTAAAETALPPAEGFWQQANLAGDWAGLKPQLTDDGIAVSLFDIEEVQDDAAGGVRRGSGYNGATVVSLSADLETLSGWQGALVGFSAAELRGHGVSEFDTGNLLTVSNIETEPQSRIFDLYLEQTLADGRLTLRAGQMLPADEFVTTHYGAALVNSSFAWPALLGADLPGDDPVGVVSSPALWGKFETSGPLSGEIGVYEGTSSSGQGPLEARQSTSNGNGVLVFAEATYTIRPTAEGPLPAVFKLGGWYHSAEFDVLATDPFAPPHRQTGDYGYYAVLDKLFYHVPDSADRGLGGFIRIAGAPSDRNLVSFYLDLGVNYKGLWPERADDVMALGFGWAEISRGAADLGGADPSHTGAAGLARDHEAVVELTYQIAAAPWWTLQPDLQYIMHPDLGTIDPTTEAHSPRIPNAVVLGLRTLIRF